MISTTWPILFVGLSTLAQTVPAISPAAIQSTAPTGKQYTITTQQPTDPQGVDPKRIDRMPNPYNGPADPNKIDRMVFYNGPADPNQIDPMAFGVVPKAQPQTPSITLPPGFQFQPIVPNTPAPKSDKGPKDRSTTPLK